MGGAGNSYNSSTPGSGGYNGGANGGIGKNGYNGGCGGGGATNICITNRGTLNNYSSYRLEIIIVAGGAGGREGQGKSLGDNGAPGGIGGGTTGGKSLTTSPDGGSQTTGYAFGFGQSGYDGYYNNSGRAEGSGGGGGGYYGGASAFANGGSGGSGYVGGISNGYTASGVRSDNGYAIITLLP